MCARQSASVRRLADTRAQIAGFTRFLRNRRVSAAEIVATAAARTDAAAAGRHALIVEDTSEINYAAKAGRKRGLGRVGNGRDVGLFVHPALAVDAADGMVLGLCGAQIWRRTGCKAPDYQLLPIEAKESCKWLSTARAACAALPQAALTTVVADREADIYEVLARLPDARTHVLIRAVRDRGLTTGTGRLFDTVAIWPEAGRLRLWLPARPGRPAREIALSLRFGAVTVKQPLKGADPRDPATLAINVVEVREIDPPSQKEAVLWRLLTSHSLASAADAAALVDLYRRRWTIEQVFRTLKSQGLDLEDSLIADGAALESLAAAGLLAAVRVMQMVHGRGQAGDALPAARLFEARQIEVLRALTPRLEGKTAKQKNPHPGASLAWAAWHIARLGGWSGYATERPPGPITFSNGLKRFSAIAEGYFLERR